MTHRTRKTQATITALAVLGLLSIASRPASAQPSYSRTDQARLDSYALTVDHLEKAAQAELQMQKIAAADPVVARSIRDGSGVHDLDKELARLKSMPALAAAIAGSGLSPEDVALTTTCAVGTRMAARMREHKAPPGQAEAWMDKMLGWRPSAEQLAFDASHLTEMHAFMKTIGMER